MSDTSVVTKSRRAGLCRVSSGAQSTLAAVTHIVFGDGGTDASGNPIAPSEEQSELTHQIAEYPVDGVSYPAETTARYTVTIPKNDLPGARINEAALVDADGNLTAIKTMFTKQKDADVSFVFTFDDEF